MPAPNPNAFTRCPDCGALVSARITNPTCPKRRPPVVVDLVAKVDAFFEAFTAAFTAPPPPPLQTLARGGIVSGPRLGNIVSGPLLGNIVIDPPNRPPLSRGGLIPLPIDDTPARRRSNRRIR